MQIVTDTIKDWINTIPYLCTILWKNITFSNVLALFAVVISVIVYWWSKRSVQAQAYVTMLREYASVEMCNSIRKLRNWFNEHKNEAATIWWKDLTEQTQAQAKAIELDKARRYVDHYFNTAKEMKKAGLISSDFYKKLISSLEGDEFKKMIEDMSKKFCEEGWPNVPELPDDISVILKK